MYIPVSSFHEPFSLSARFDVNDKPAVAYGLNWFEVVGDDERDVVAIMANVKVSDSVPEAYSHAQDGQKLMVFVCEDWPVNLVISADEVSLPLCDLHVIPCDSPMLAIAETIESMELVTRELIRDALVGNRLPEHVDTYIDNNWTRHLQALLAQGEVSHVEAQIMEGNLPEGFNSLAIKAA